jgi:NAD(P)-dependent dehydrogenase (short-subunit alcohol dehydrogenase family)
MQQKKTILVTGATSGIGFEAAKVMAGMGHRVLLHARTEAKGRASIEALRREAPSADVAFVCADFSSLADVRRLAEEVASEHTRLDVLLNNAGGAWFTRTLTRDGYESTFAVNHLAPFLLTRLLLERLKASAPARIVTVASAAHRRAQLDFDDLMNTKGYKVMEAYGRSKLANILFTRALARRLAGTGVTANALHPGVVRTHIGQRNFFARIIGQVVMLAIAVPAAQGAQTSIYLATSPEVEGQSGGYYSDRRLTTPTPAAQDDTAAERLWEMSERLTGLLDAR